MYHGYYDPKNTYKLFPYTYRWDWSIKPPASLTSPSHIPNLNSSGEILALRRLEFSSYRRSYHALCFAFASESLIGLEFSSSKLCKLLKKMAENGNGTPRSPTAASAPATPGTPAPLFSGARVDSLTYERKSMPHTAGKCLPVGVSNWGTYHSCFSDFPAPDISLTRKVSYSFRKQKLTWIYVKMVFNTCVIFAAGSGVCRNFHAHILRYGRTNCESKIQWS